ncbi:MAG: AsnC family transcriptional regulator [Parcubacteria group bacterium CG11_big_fil_rev_8_21_14_0_20_48_46]|nr:MAG: AsnC family transcriptional regulator [Parcubacteria group bacterium CG_4_10_14_0_8_um_filter_48_154]PIZ77455.1 MAG: AsnC family transcriptional regulator [bacterium CG_4_10_14_0_2_um_filter_48_144]PJC40032.1 MAG: AsnC family transcriptional regulator [Parcubacteria group bacterium CG_4_9_14_0_2_um_filter_48_40]PJE52966.1 MAG: AsnC family transcriptional regulator [Parcubacteria group bacterium CG11_big_fil_rev_8_21_14_0_20_48_46]
MLNSLHIRMSFGISTKADYGVVLMTALAENAKGSPLSLRAISKHKRLPYSFLAQIVRHLKQARLVVSKEGLGGGYALARKSNTITLKEIVEILDGPIAIAPCTRDGRACPTQHICGTKSEWEKLKTNISDLLGDTTLADIIKSSS